MFCKIIRHSFRGYLQTGRSFSTCACLQNDLLKSKKMLKLIARNKDKKIGHMNIRNPFEKIPAGPKPTKSYRRMTAGAQRRTEQMATIYQEHIAQIMADGQFDVNVEIVKVKVLLDMGSINVYWEGSDDLKQDNATQQLLDEKAGYLRHTLHERNFLGYIPKIVFVKDLSTVKERKIDEIFSRLKLDTAIIPDDFMQSSSDTGQTQREFSQNIYGLQHDVLMQKVTDAKQGKPIGAQEVKLSEDELLTRTARKEYIKKFSKHLKGKKNEKEREKRIREYIEDNYSYEDYDSDVEIESPHDNEGRK